LTVSLPAARNIGMNMTNVTNANLAVNRNRAFRNNFSARIDS
jgi:hypothetical protein